MRRLAALPIAAAILAGCLSGCGSKSSSEKAKDLAGKYEAIRVEDDAQAIEETYFGMPIGILMQFELFEDGTAVGYIYGKPDDEKINWKKDGSKLTLFSADENATDENGNTDEPIELSIDGDNLVMEEKNVKYTLKKVGEFSTVASEEENSQSAEG